jgi:hypothetical protein
VPRSRGRAVQEGPRRLSRRKADCTRCHDPHASTEGLLKGSVHAPIAGGGGCDSCHGPPARPLPSPSCRRKRALLTCHDEAASRREAITSTRLRGRHVPELSRSPHLGLAQARRAARATPLRRVPRGAGAHVSIAHRPDDGKGCLSCHQPARLKQKGCSSRTARTLRELPREDSRGRARRQGRASALRGGDCVSCHDPHGSECRRSSRTGPTRCASHATRTPRRPSRRDRPRARPERRLHLLPHPHGAQEAKLLKKTGRRSARAATATS